MRLLTVFVAWICLLPAMATSEERIALVIGNSSYSSVAPLDNARSDAELMAASLTEVGFEVTLLADATEIELKRGIAQFGRALRAAGPETTGLFYYAGHGVQSFGANYLLPVDAELTDAADLDLVALEAASVLRQMASARNRTNIFILDACRNNPFENIRDLNDNGLAEMNAPTGTYLAYATAPGRVAFDGEGINSPFTAALARNIPTEGAPIEQIFKAVRVEVINETNGQQTPWDTSSLTADFQFKPARALTPEEVAEQQLWASVSQSRDPVQLMLFLRTHPDGTYEGEARALLAVTLAEELEQPAPEPVPDVQIAAAPEPAPVQTPAVDGPDEMAMMEAARSSGRLEDYQAYLDAFPDGLFSELVKIEIAALVANASEDPDPGTPRDPPEQDTVAILPAEVGLVFYDQPIVVGTVEILGLTIEEAAKGSPMFAPIEGIPEELWKDQSCSNCHQWTRAALCDQGTTYLSEAAAAALTKPHPYGGSFKANLRAWAQGGCE